MTNERHQSHVKSIQRRVSSQRSAINDTVVTVDGHNSQKSGLVSGYNIHWSCAIYSTVHNLTAFWTVVQNKSQKCTLNASRYLFGEQQWARSVCTKRRNCHGSGPFDAHLLLHHIQLFVVRPIL